MELNNKFVIVVPLYNAGDLILLCLNSILVQTHNDLGIIIRDDMSTDNTPEIISKKLGIDGIINQKTKINGKDVIFIRNEEKYYPVGNTYDSVMRFVKNKETIVGVVDGDDLLTKRTAVQKIQYIYDTNPDKWMVWSQHTKSTGGVGESKPMPSDNIIYSGREYWSVTHFRTSKAGLFYKLDKKDLMDPFVEESYYTFAGDAAFLFPFCEMCGNEHSYFLNEILYMYNNHLPTNEHNKNMNNAIKYGNHIRQYGKRYKKINSL